MANETTTTTTKPIAPSAATTSTTPAAGTTTTPAAPAKPVEMYPSIEMMQKVCPGADVQTLKKTIPRFLKAMAGAKLVSRNQLIAIVSTIYAETFPKWTPTKEYGADRARYAPYVGRGYIQLTWEENYLKAGKFLGVGDQLVKNPDMAMNEDLAWPIYMWYWTGGDGIHNPSKKAEAGDWRGARSEVNGGYNGLEEFLAAVDRAMKVFDRGIDPAALGALPATGPDYGTGCIDTGGASGRTINAAGSSQADMLAHALGLHALDRTRSHEMRLFLDVAAEPKILELDAQKTMGLKNFGADLDGEDYTVDEVVFTFDQDLTAEVFAYKPDPNAPAAQVYLHDTKAGLGGAQVATGPVPTGDIPAKIFQMAQQALGKKTAQGPDGGQNACAYAVNLFCIQPAGLKSLGDPVSPWGVAVAVASSKSALLGGRGTQITAAQAVPGDIWISPGDAHIGVCMTAGCTQVRSNSSSKAIFSWDDSLSFMDEYYAAKYGGVHAIFRVKS